MRCSSGSQQSGTANGGAVGEIKEWQAIMEQLRGLPAKMKGELPMVPIDGRAAEIRAIKVG